MLRVLVIFGGVFLVSCGSFESRLGENRNNNNNSGGASAGRVEPTQPISGHIAPQGNIVSYADTVDRVAPAVVTVHARSRVRAPQQFEFQGDPFFDWFFGGGGRPNRFRGGPPPMQEESSLGSGVIVREDGYILTNDHVIDGAQQISVDLVDRRNFKATVVGAGKHSDLGVLEISACKMQ